MEKYVKLLIQSFGEHRIKTNEPLSLHVYSKLGGPAEIFFIATNKKELKDILDAAEELKLPYLVLGNGTKTFVSDKGVLGLVIKNRTSGLKIGAVKGKISREGIGVEEAAVEVDSGVSLGRLNEFLISQKLQTIADVSLNATVGGALWVSPSLIEVVQKLTVWEKGEILELSASELKRNEHIILNVTLKIKSL